MFNRAVDLCEKGNHKDALKLFLKCPKTTNTKFCIATCYKSLGDEINLKIAKGIFEKQLNHDPSKINYVSTITQLTKIYMDLAQYNEAIAILKEGLEQVPNDSILNYNLGHLYKNAGQYQEAVKYFKNALKYDNKHCDTYVELSNTYGELNMKEEQLQTIETGIQKSNDSLSMKKMLGDFYGIEKYDKALDVYDSIIPQLEYGTRAKVLINKGQIFSRLGNISKSNENYKKAMDCDVSNCMAIQNYLMNLLYDTNITFKNLLFEHLKYGSYIQKLNNFQITHEHTKNDKIRLGYISGDFFEVRGKMHPMIYFLQVLLNNYDKSKFDVYCYSNTSIGNVGLYSKEIKWRNIKFITGKSAVNQLLGDNLDILVDLSGHTQGNRMDIFSNRIAPVQINYLGYPCITGLPNIDYYLIDKSFGISCPKTLMMNFCFTHYYMFKTNRDLKCSYQEKKYITFGSLNKPNKINQKVIDLWEKILEKVPDSKLVIKKTSNVTFKYPERIITFELLDKYDDYLLSYNNIDISLDTFPYAGTTTTCESLSMGTPVITLKDAEKIHQNTTTSILTNSNLQNYVATNEEEYISIAVKTVELVKTDEKYKNKIQEKFLYGNVTNDDLYIRNYEKVLMNICK